MDASKHTVTLPMRDYEKLMQIKKEHSYMETTIEAIIIHAKQGEKVVGTCVKDRLFSAIIEVCENAR